MRDPRCPSCAGKVSATADYCMHCGAEFEAPVEADATDDGGRSTRSAGTVTVSDDADVGTATGRTETGSARGRAETAAARGQEDTRGWADASGGSTVGAGTDRSSDPGTFGAGLEAAVTTALAPLIWLLERSETLVWTVVLGVPLLAFAFIGRDFPGTWFLGYSVAAVVSAALAVYVGRQTHADQVLAAAGIGSGAIVLATRLLGLAGLAVGEGLDAAAVRLLDVYPSLLLAAGLLLVGFLLRKQ